MNDQINNIKNLIKNYTIETTPKVYQQIEDFKVLLTPNTSVYITYLPDEDPKNIVNTAKKIKDEGFEPIPHLPARSIKDFDKLKQYLGNLSEIAGVSKILIIGGSGGQKGIISSS